jgi:hypothetical protein
MANEVVEGQLGGGLPHLSFGHGPPLVVFPGAAQHGSELFRQRTIFR